MTWLPEGFVPPSRVDVPGGFHLRAPPGGSWTTGTGTSLERSLDRLTPAWIGTAWPFRQPRCLGRDISWPDWLALPDLG